MKHLYNFIFIFTFFAIQPLSGSAFELALDYQSMVIDSTDTVYFDLSKATINGSQLVVPVEIMTSEPVNAVDFSFRYNHSELDYDTISNLVFYLQGMAYYNPNDSVVRFTSSSLTPVGVASTLVNVNFNLTGSQISAGDFYDVKGYLNGIKCTAVIINQLNVGFSELNEKFRNTLLYPNPAAGIVTLYTEYSGEYFITDMQGRIVKENSVLHPGIRNTIDMSNVQNGVYFLRSVSKDVKSALRIIIQH